MAVTVAVLRKSYAGTASDAVWTKVVLPQGTRNAQITIQADAWVDGKGGGYTDGVAHGAGEGTRYTALQSVTMPLPASARDDQAVYVSGRGAACAFDVIAFGAEGV